MEPKAHPQFESAAFCLQCGTKRRPTYCGLSDTTKTIQLYIVKSNPVHSELMQFKAGILKIYKNILKP